MVPAECPLWPFEPPGHCAAGNNPGVHHTSSARCRTGQPPLTSWSSNASNHCVLASPKTYHIRLLSNSTAKHNV